MDSSEEAAIRRRIKEEMRIEELEARLDKFAEQIEGMAHALVDQITERWDDKLLLFKGDLKDWIKAETVSPALLPAAVRKEHAAIEAEKQSQARSTARFWVAIVVGGISIASAIFSIGFWIWQLTRG